MKNTGDSSMIIFKRANYLNLSGIALLVAILSTAAVGAEQDRGKALYENHCRFCHEDRVFTRKNPLVTSRESLLGWVTSWSSHTGLNWDRQEIEDVTRYLNKRYYQFD